MLRCRPQLEPLEDRTLLTVQAVSLVHPTLFSGSLTAHSNYTSVSNDGRFVAFTSTATNLVAGQIDTNNTQDAFLSDRVTGTTALISHSSASPTTAGNNFATTPVVSADGRYVAFASHATNLVAGQTDTNNGSDVFLYDRLTGTTTLVSHASGSATATGNRPSGFGYHVMSADGRYIAYESEATNLVAGQTEHNGHLDIFLYDRVTGATVLVSRSILSPTTTGNGYSRLPVITPDGRHVAYISLGRNMIPGQTEGNNSWDVFLYDRVAGATTLVTHSSTSPTTTANNSSQDPYMSVDGRYVVYSSFATNLVAGQSDGNNAWDVFLYDRVTDTTTLVSRSTVSPTSTGDRLSYVGPISHDGRYVTFRAEATNLVPGQIDTNGVQDVFVYDRVAGTTTLASRTAASATTAGNGISVTPAISGDGRRVFFSSQARNLVVGQIDLNSNWDTFLYDQETGTTRLISHSTAGPTTTGNGPSIFGPSISQAITPDGRYAGFISSASDLVSGDQDGTAGAFLFLTNRTATWTGGGNDANWTTGANWQGGVAPAPGDELVFPAGAARLTNTNNFAAGVGFVSLTLSGPGYSLSGNAVTLSGGLTNSSSGANMVALNLTLEGVHILTAAAGTQLTLAGFASGPGAVLKLGPGQVNVTGSLNAPLVRVVEGPLNVAGAVTADTFSNAGGTVFISATGNVTASGHFLQSGGRTSLGGGTINAATVSLNQGVLDGAGIVSGSVTNNALLDVSGAGALATLTLGGNLTNNGNLTIASGKTLAVGGDLTNAGGTALIGADAALSVAGTYRQTGGLTMLGEGGTTAGMMIADMDIQAGVLAGTGAILGSVTNSGVVTVGGAGATGIIYITGDYTQTDRGVLNLEIGGYDYGATYDAMYVEGTATLGGTLNVSLLGDFVPEPEDAFLALYAGAVSGEFATITGLNFATDRAFYPYYFENGLLLYTYAF